MVVSHDRDLNWDTPDAENAEGFNNGGITSTNECSSSCVKSALLVFFPSINPRCSTPRSTVFPTPRTKTGEDVKNDQFDAAYDLSSADDGEWVFVHVFLIQSECRLDAWCSYLVTLRKTASGCKSDVTP